MVKPASVNSFRTSWIYYIFSVIPIPTNKRKNRAGKAPDQTKLTPSKKIKIIEVCYSLHCFNKLLYITSVKLC